MALKNKIPTVAMTAALGLAVGLVGCASSDGTATDTTTDTEVVATDTTEDTDLTSSAAETVKKSFFDATGYLGDLEDGKSFLYLRLGESNTMISLTDDEHEGDDAETYTGKEEKDADGKTTITDTKSGKSISFTLTENGDGTADIDVDGHGTGALKSYEGNIFSVIGGMIDDDVNDEEVDDEEVDDEDAIEEDVEEDVADEDADEEDATKKDATKKDK